MRTVNSIIRSLERNLRDLEVEFINANSRDTGFGEITEFGGDYRESVNAQSSDNAHIKALIEVRKASRALNRKISQLRKVYGD